MNLRTGVDLIEIERIRSAIERHGEHFLKRIFTPAEIELCCGKIESLAARYAAKEAVAKALGCGIGDISWQEIEVLHDSRSAPVLNLYGEAKKLAENLGLDSRSISLSHSQDHAIAFVVLAALTERPA